jgi:myo-inositol-1(or 4)-monophosphatase
LIRDAGALALGYFRRLATLTITAKGPQDMASEADLEVERMIRARIVAAFPGDAFLGEETGRTDFIPGQGIWVVDPMRNANTRPNARAAAPIGASIGVKNSSRPNR